MFTVRSVDRLARMRNPLGPRSLGIISLNPLPRLRVAMRILLRGLPAPLTKVWQNVLKELMACFNLKVFIKANYRSLNIVLATKEREFRK